MLKSMFHPIVEHKNVLIDCLLKGYLGECYLHSYKIYVKRRVARGNRIVSINKVIFPNTNFSVLNLTAVVYLKMISSLIRN